MVCRKEYYWILCVIPCRFFQTSNMTHTWIDGSPYGFQQWQRPSQSTVAPRAWYKLFDRAWQWYKLYPSYTSSIEPTAEVNTSCTAVIRQPSSISDMKWIKVPCNSQHESASYICEFTNPDMLLIISQRKLVMPGSYAECASNRLMLINVCISIHSVILQRKNQLDTLCTADGTRIFRPPKYITSKLTTSWTSEELLTVKTLQEMNHRWPSVMDSDTVEDRFIDKILVQANNSNPGHLTLHFSRKSFNYFTFSLLNRSISSQTALHITCEMPLIIATQKCLIGQWTCKDGTCIISHHVCDGMRDCPDGSDETECYHVCIFKTKATPLRSDCFKMCFLEHCTCSDLYFHCRLGGCVPWSKVCDGTPDCPNEEDEEVCYFITESRSLVKIAQKCGNLELDMDITVGRRFTNCSDGKQIWENYLNDLVPDCIDQSDERLYSGFLKNGSSAAHFSEPLLCKYPEDTTCEKNFLGPCYPRHLHCVYEIVDMELHGCRNGGHLKYCKHHSCPSQFKCPEAYCIPTHLVCNGRQDCPNGEDELNCSHLSYPGLLLCRYDNICVHPYDVSSGHVKCRQSKDDKALVGFIPCPLLCQCLGHSILCSQKSTPTDDVTMLLRDKKYVNIRSLKIRNIPIMITYTIWEGAYYVFLLQLEISNAGLSLIGHRPFSQLVYLRKLNLSHNSIAKIQTDLFSNLKNVKIMDLNSNLITMINSTNFAHNHLLQFLTLRQNALQILEFCSFKVLRSLATLDLSNNRIFSLRKDIFCHKTTAHLKHLDISQNPLQDISIDLLKPVAHILQFLNSTPISLCCFFSEVENCSPKLTFFVSSCKYLIASRVTHVFYWVAGIILLVFVSLSLSWIMHKNSVSQSKKGIFFLLTLANLSSGWFHGFYFLSIATVGYIFSGKYSFYYELWKQHPVCVITNILSYTPFMMELFTSCLLAGCRLIAVLFPFKASRISAIPTVVACVSFLLLSVAMAAMPFVGWGKMPPVVEGKNFGLFLLLPQLNEEWEWVWSLAFVLMPTCVIILVLIAINGIALRSLWMSLSMLETNAGQSRRKRVRAIKITAVTLVCKVCAYAPVAAVHLAVLCGYYLDSRITFIVITISLFLMHKVSLYLYFGMSCVRQKCRKWFLPSRRTCILFRCF